MFPDNIPMSFPFFSFYLLLSSSFFLQSLATFLLPINAAKQRGRVVSCAEGGSLGKSQGIILRDFLVSFFCKKIPGTIEK